VGVDLQNSGMNAVRLLVTLSTNCRDQINGKNRMSRIPPDAKMNGETKEEEHRQNSSKNTAL